MTGIGQVCKPHDSISAQPCGFLTIEQGNPDMGIALLAISNVLMFVALVVIIARVICRFWILQTEGLDDWFALLAAFVASAMVVTMSIGSGSPRLVANWTLMFLQGLRMARGKWNGTGMWTRSCLPR